MSAGNPTYPPPAHLQSSQIQPQLQAEELTTLDSSSSSVRRRTQGQSSEPSATATILTPTRTETSSFDHSNPIRRFWSRHVSVAAPIQFRRDHLALERTFLGFVRTSVAFSMLGVLIAQLFRLKANVDGQQGKRPEHEGEGSVYYAMGVPLAATCVASSLVVVVLGAVRFWRQQNAMLRGKVWAGGWELLGIAGLSTLLSIALLVLVLVGDERTGHG